MPFSLGFVAGVTPTKWVRTWNERHPDIELTVFRVDADEQTDVLHDGRADACLVRLPIQRHGLNVIPLYREVPVVVTAKDHDIAVLDASVPVGVADLAGEHLLQEPDTVPEWRAVAVEVHDGSRRSLPRMRDLDEAMEQVAAGVGILILPHSLARLHSRKDVASRAVEGVADTEIALVWSAQDPSEHINEFVGIVRGRTASSSRGDTVVVRGEPEKKVKKTAKAKEAAKAAREAAAKKSPRAPRPSAPGRTRNTSAPRGKRRGSR